MHEFSIYLDCGMRGGAMYIPEFWAGVIVTIVVEFAAIMFFGIFSNKKKGDEEK